MHKLIKYEQLQPEDRMTTASMKERERIDLCGTHDGEKGSDVGSNALAEALLMSIGHRSS